FHEIHRQPGDDAAVGGGILEQRRDDAAIVVGAGDVVEDLMGRGRISGEPDREPADGARALVHLSENAGWSVTVCGERLEEIVRVRLGSVHPVESLGGGVWIPNRFE